MNAVGAAAALAWLLAAPASWAATEAPEARVLRAAREFLADQAARAGLAKPVVEVTMVTGSRGLPACRQPVAVAAVDTRYASRLRFAATCPGSDGARQEFILKARISAEVVVAAAAVPAGRVIADDELALERRDVSTVPDAISEIEAVAGLSSRRALRAGQMVQKPMLVAPVLVRRGEPVHIVVRSGPVEVSTAGEALETGRGEDTVRVRNVATGRVIRARVTGSATVEPLDVPITMPPQFRD